MIKDLGEISKFITDLADASRNVAGDAETIANILKQIALGSYIGNMNSNNNVDPFVFAVTIFILSCFIGYYVVWRVTPALHTPLMSVTNAISGIIIIGGIIAVGPDHFGFSKIVGFFAVIIASINIFGGFVVTHRMLEMFRKK